VFSKIESATLRGIFWHSWFWPWLWGVMALLASLPTLWGRGRAMGAKFFWDVHAVWRRVIKLGTVSYQMINTDWDITRPLSKNWFSFIVKNQPRVATSLSKYKRHRKRNACASRWGASTRKMMKPRVLCRLYRIRLASLRRRPLSDFSVYNKATPGDLYTNWLSW